MLLLLGYNEMMSSNAYYCLCASMLERCSTSPEPSLSCFIDLALPVQMRSSDCLLSLPTPSHCLPLSPSMYYLQRLYARALLAHSYNGSSLPLLLLRRSRVTQSTNQRVPEPAASAVAAFTQILNQPMLCPTPSADN
ncbi:hypothetical protein Q8A73_001195 [Channa argus]|nr:hypothetical protein Q8A73_001195 [Channa argus]